MNIAIGNDHAGVAYKQAIITALQAQGHQVLNCGTDTPESVDYPDFGHAVARAIEEGKAQVGIVICGSAHNDANVVSIPARFTAIEQAVAIVETFLATPFEGGRHQKRVCKI